MLWKKREFTTLLTVDEDERDPNELRTAFTLIRSVSDHSFLCICRALHPPSYNRSVTNHPLVCVPHSFHPHMLCESPFRAFRVAHMKLVAEFCDL